MNVAKAIGLLSGGLDSTLAVRMMLDQGIDVIAVNFTGPFCTCTKKGCRHEASRVAETMGVEIRLVSCGPSRDVFFNSHISWSRIPNGHRNVGRCPPLPNCWTPCFHMRRRIWKEAWLTGR